MEVIILIKKQLSLTVTHHNLEIEDSAEPGGEDDYDDSEGEERLLNRDW